MDFENLLDNVINFELDIFFKDMFETDSINLHIKGLKSIDESFAGGNKILTVRGVLLKENKSLYICTGQNIKYSSFKTTFEKALMREVSYLTKGKATHIQQLYDNDLMILITKQTSKLTKIKIEKIKYGNEFITPKEYFSKQNSPLM